MLALLLCLVPLPVLFVLVDLVLQITLLLYLIVSDEKLASLQRNRRILHMSRNIRSFEAYEGKRHPSLTDCLEDLDRVDITVLAEQLTKLLITCLWQESFDKEVAPLF